MGPVCEALRAQCQPLWQALLGHPFVVEMAKGTLPPRKFAFYVGQNILYLKEFARLMALGVAKAEDEPTMREFAAAVAAILDLELPKNRQLLEEVRRLEPTATEAKEMAPATLAYTRHLLAVGYSGGVPEIMAAVMPCDWSYGEIGLKFVADLPDQPVYRDWIEFFAGREYWQNVERLQQHMERLCAGLSEEALARLSEIFTASARLEHAFWDMAYNEEGWPI